MLNKTYSDENFKEENTDSKAASSEKFSRINHTNTVGTVGVSTQNE